MYVELWNDLHLVFWGAYSSMSKRNQEICIEFIKWIEDQGKRYAGIDPVVIEWYVKWIEPQRDQAAGLRRSDLTRSILFLRYLNFVRPADQCFTQVGCQTFGYYWYDNACHKDVKRIPAPPLPPPKPPPPPPPPPEPPIDDGVFSQLEYNADVLMWWTENTGRSIAENADRNLWDWEAKLGSYYGDYAAIVSALDAFTLTVNVALGQAYVNFEHIENWIGDVTKLEENSLVDAILAAQTSGDVQIQNQIDTLYDLLDITWLEESQSTTYSTIEMFGQLKKIVAKWIEQGEKFGEMSTDAIAGILKDDYDIVTDTIAIINSRLDNIEREIGIVTETVTLDLEKPAYDVGEGFEFIIPVSIGVLKSVISTLVDQVWGALDEIIDTFTKPINALLQNVYDISDPWLAALKERLGDVGGEYDLAADPVFQEVAASAKVAEDIITELPEWWVSVLAGRIQGYIDTGIGSKGEKGDPGLPGAQGIQGVPGVQGEKGEPGEGVGMAIEDIDSQLKERLVFGAAIVTDNLTGVVDYNLEKIGEVFTRYDLEVKPITDFLTADMQETLTGIVATFETPEALIAFILDVPEGEEDVTYELMQLLIAQTMERGLE